MPANNDQLSPLVILTRANNKDLFNIASEISYISNTSPADTEWALASSSSLQSLTFSDWETTFGGAMPPLNQNVVIHLLSLMMFIFGVSVLRSKQLNLVQAS